MKLHNVHVIYDDTSIGKIEAYFNNDGVKIYSPVINGTVRMSKKQAISLAKVINTKYKVKE